MQHFAFSIRNALILARLARHRVSQGWPRRRTRFVDYETSRTRVLDHEHLQKVRGGSNLHLNEIPATKIFERPRSVPYKSLTLRGTPEHVDRITIHDKVQ